MLCIEDEIKWMRENERYGEPSMSYVTKSFDHLLIAQYYCFMRAVECASNDAEADRSKRALLQTKTKLADRGYIIIEETDYSLGGP